MSNCCSSIINAKIIKLRGGESEGAIKKNQRANKKCFKK